MSQVKIEINNSEITQDVDNGYLSTDIASASSTLTLDSITNFAINQILVLGKIGQEKTEIIKTHAATAPTGSTVTLASNTIYTHNRGEEVSISKWDQYEISHSVTATGTKTALTTTLGSGLVAIDVTREDTLYYDTEYDSGYYFIRRKNSITSEFSGYSDAIPYLGYEANSVGGVIDSALKTSGEKIDDVITKDFLTECLNEGRMELDQAIGAERWSYRTEFDYSAGQVVPGMNKLTLPTDMKESATFKNLLSLRIGRDKLPLTKVDKTALNRWYQGVARTTLSSNALTADVTLTLTSSGDFDDSGEVVVAGSAVTSTLDTVSYTANDLSTTLSGVTGIQVAGHTAGAVVWQGATFGRPMEYTVDNGEIIFSQPFSDDEAGENIVIDYYKELEIVDSDADLLDEPGYRMYVPYLRYRMKEKRDTGLKRDEDNEYKSWKEKRDAAVAKEYTGNDIRLSIDLPC
jgi:hypothetical protein